MFKKNARWDSQVRHFYQPHSTNFVENNYNGGGAGNTDYGYEDNNRPKRDTGGIKGDLENGGVNERTEESKKEPKVSEKRSSFQEGKVS